MSAPRPIERGDAVQVLEGAFKDRYGLASAVSNAFVSVRFDNSAMIHIIAREYLVLVPSDAEKERDVSTYTVKTRTEKRLRARDVTTMAAPLDARPLEEHTVHIAELFAGNVVVDSGEGANEREAYAALGRELCRAFEAMREVHADRLEALNAARYGGAR